MKDTTSAKISDGVPNNNVPVGIMEASLSEAAEQAASFETVVAATDDTDCQRSQPGAWAGQAGGSAPQLRPSFRGSTGNFIEQEAQEVDFSIQPLPSASRNETSNANIELTQSGASLSTGGEGGTLTQAHSITQEEGETRLALPIAEEMRIPTASSAGSSNRPRGKYADRETFLLGFALLTAVWIAVITVAVTCAVRKKYPSTTSDGLDISSIGNSSAVAPPGALTHSDLPAITVKAIQENPESSAQAMALEWINNDPNVQQYSLSRRLQRFALATLYYATNGDEWSHSDGWMSYDTHECEWHTTGSFGFELFPSRQELMEELRIFYEEYFINANQAFEHWSDKVRPMQANATVCGNDNGNGELLYKKLHLYHNALQGTIPPEVYVLLNSLESFDLSRNFLGGRITSEIGLLSKLKYFSHLDSQHTGGLPTEIGNLRNLEVFRFVLSQLSGKIPSEIGQCSNLMILSTRDNPLTGALPSELSKLSDLVFMNFVSNLLTGIPTELGLLKELSILALEDNPLNTIIPSELGQLTRMEVLKLQNTNITGTIPTQLSELINVLDVTMDGNMLSGSLPSNFGNWERVRKLTLSNNKLSGSLPSQVGLWNMMKVFDVSSNQLSQALPTEMGEMTNLEVLTMADNQFSGPLPWEMSVLRNLTRLNLENNPFLSGDLSLLLEQLVANGSSSSIAWLTISNTSLSGEIPSILCQLSHDSLQFDCSQRLCGCSCSCSAGSN